MAKNTSQPKITIESNPFEPSGSGAPLLEKGFWLPENSWKQPIVKQLKMLDSQTGRRAIAIIGEYGSGKSYILRWLERIGFPERKVRPFYFENPEVKFYDLANALLRRIGRKHFAKLLYELCVPYRKRAEQRSLFDDGFDAYLARSSKKPSPYELSDFQEAIKSAEITDDEEIAYCLARVIVDTPRKPYFEYRDFVSTKPGSIAPEKQEARFFGAILRVLRMADGVDRIAFLLDEFEQVSLQRKLTRKDAQDYLITLKRLLDNIEAGDLWVVLAMTPDAADKTKALDPALWERCYEWTIPELPASEAADLVRQRIERANISPFPFEQNFIETLTPNTYSVPRRLVKVFHVAVNKVMETRRALSNQRLREIELSLYPSDDDV